MKVEFNQGVPPGCIEWLYENVGRGNMNVIQDSDDYAWFYERVEQEIPSTDPSMDSNIKYVPTITVKDPKLAIWFALKWS
jgi:hypothetical protein